MVVRHGHRRHSRCHKCEAWPDRFSRPPSRNFLLSALLDAGQEPLAARPRGLCTGRDALAEAPLILVVEDEYPLQGIVEDHLQEGGFDTHILSSGEEALTLFRGKVADYKALVTDVNLKGNLSG